MVEDRYASVNMKVLSIELHYIDLVKDLVYYSINDYDLRLHMEKIVNIHEAKTHLSRLLARVMGGEEIVIAKSGKPVARLVPFDGRPVERNPGTAAGDISLSSDFDAPLPDDILESFET